MKTRIITIIACLLSLTAGRAADRLQMENITMKPGEVKELKLSLALDNEKYAGVQFDIQLPTGLSLGMEGSGVYYALAGIQPNDLECNVTCIQEGTYRFMLYSSSLKMLKGGELMTLRLKAEKGMELREYTLRLNDVMLSDIDGAVTKLGSSTATVKLTDFFNLTYMVDGEHYKTVEYEYGAKITPEAEPTKEGYTFSGWSGLPETMPAKDVTVTGTFTINKYKLMYIVDGEVYKTYEVKYGSTITPEAEPKKEGYTFSGWSDIPETMPAKDVTVTGTFTVNKYKLTYIVDGEVYKSYEVKYGSTITPEAEPKKEGYAFSGWSDIPETMPAYDVTVTGYFTQDKKPGDANGDGTVNAADIVEVVNYIMKNPSAIFDASAADVNGDGVVNAADIVEMVNIIMAAK